MTWKATFSNLKQTFSYFETSVLGTLLMWAQFCQRLKAESKEIYKKYLMVFLYIIIFKQDKNENEVKIY